MPPGARRAHYYLEERILRGVSAAPGIALGSAIVLDLVQSDGAAVPAPDRPAQLEQARRALEDSATELEAIAHRMHTEGRASAADIVETGVLMARDPMLHARLEARVIDGGLPAPSALRAAAEDIACQLAQLDDRLLAERADDVRSLGRRAAARAAGLAAGFAGGVLVASSLGPADVAELGPNTKGVALAGGGVTAHAAIVARSLGVPMVVGLGSAINGVIDGEEVVLDGGLGLMVRFPDPRRVEAARAEAGRHREARNRAVADRLQPAVTQDGHRVRVLANAASVAEVAEAIEQGAEGIGLLRTELLFLEARGWPDQAQHARFLEPILAPLAGQTATVRLLDFGGDKTPPFLAGSEGRGIELLLLAPDALRAQLAAILSAGERTKLRILVPMVSSVEQVRAVRAAIRAVLGGRPSPALGAMIETPEAAEAASELAGELDFVSLGTNDLTQLVLGMDRERSRTAPVTHRAVLRLIDKTMSAARAARIPVDVCGEAASDFDAMPVMVGLGADELSVAAARVGEVRQWIRELSFAACREASRKRLLLGESAHATRERI